jgi:hypothetical protein
MVFGMRYLQNSKELQIDGISLIFWHIFTIFVFKIESTKIKSQSRIASKNRTMQQRIMWARAILLAICATTSFSLLVVVVVVVVVCYCFSWWCGMWLNSIFKFLLCMKIPFNRFTFYHYHKFSWKEYTLD